MKKKSSDDDFHNYIGIKAVLNDKGCVLYKLGIISGAIDMTSPYNQPTTKEDVQNQSAKPFRTAFGRSNSLQKEFLYCVKITA